MGIELIRASPTEGRCSRLPEVPPRAQIIYFFRMQIGSRTPSGIGLGSGSRLRRMRPCLELSGELWIQNIGDLCSRAAHCQAPVLVCIDCSC